MSIDAAGFDPTSRIELSTDLLRHRAPLLSSRRRLVGWQRISLAFAVAAVAAGVVFSPRWTGVTVIGIFSLAYIATLFFRVALFRRSMHASAPSLDADEVVVPLPDDELPTYTILVPAYREPKMIPVVLEAIARLDYPRDRLEVKLILERDDETSIVAVSAMTLPSEVQVVIVPTSGPKTKPKALNYALWESTGELVTIYDAEDLPEPLQLRRAAAVMRRSPASVACVQAKLDSFNPKQNLMTEWFTLEYTMWFRQFLPGLVAGRDPVPLGGTSNHFRRAVLERVGGWDPYNVTEDADLGIRLHRLGYRVGMLDSTTYEEANSDFVNWAKQRSRWHKGYLQTWLVHMRRPKLAWRALGPRGFLSFNLFVGGTPLLAILNPIFWSLTLLWFAAQPPFLRSLYPGPLLYVGLISWLIGNFLFFYGFLITAAEREDMNLFRAAVLSPLYFLMMSVGAYKALFQLLTEPSFWEKTEHGLAKGDPWVFLG